LLKDLLGPLDFLEVHGYPNGYGYWREELLRFLGHKYSPTLHISFFIDIISKLNVNNEDVKMKMFLLSLYFLEDEIMDCYGKLNEGNISSLSYFFNIFLDIWSPLCGKVKCEMVLEYSFPCVLEILPLTYECHPHFLSFNCSPSLPFTKTTMENQSFPCRS